MFVNTENKYIWKNGSFKRWNESNVHILSHTLHYGTGVFEGVRAYETNDGPAIFRLSDHTKRLYDAASKISINIPFSESELNIAQCDTLEKNNLKEVDFSFDANESNSVEIKNCWEEEDLASQKRYCLSSEKLFHNF